MRGVPETCPACGSYRLAPERGIRLDIPEIKWKDLPAISATGKANRYLFSMCPLNRLIDLHPKATASFQLCLSKY
jgi:hypothetical protein